MDEEGRVGPGWAGAMVEGVMQMKDRKEVKRLEKKKRRSVVSVLSRFAQPAAD